MSLNMFVVVLLSFSAVCKGQPLEKPEYNIREFQTSRIVGGKEAPDGYAPHMAALVYGELIPMLVCGASIVSKRHLLSAAHCIYLGTNWQGQIINSFQGVVGSNRFDSGTVIQFKSFVCHPKYNLWTIKYDIGVLTTEDMILGERIAVIPLDYEWVDGDEPSSVTGWGRIEVYPAPVSEQLKLLYVSTISSKQCAEGVREAANNLGFAPPFDPEIEICTFHSVGQGMCNGDSGSALVSVNTRKQIGIVSWGFACAIGAPDIFVRISAFQDFLQAILEE